MRNVMMVVEVLIISCQISLKPNKGPLIAHAITMVTAIRKVTGFPAQCEIRHADFANQSCSDKDACLETCSLKIFIRTMAPVVFAAPLLRSRSGLRARALQRMVPGAGS